MALKSLRSQMNPHFIFNALNSVNSFIASSDERTANKYLSDFSHSNVKKEEIYQIQVESDPPIYHLDFRLAGKNSFGYYFL